MSLECEGQGDVCSEPGCGQFDFLPTRCEQCRRVFCYLHAPTSSHTGCSPDVAGAVAVAASPADEISARRQKCVHCDAVGPLLMHCTVCNESFCAAHRFEHEHRETKQRSAGGVTASPQPRPVFGGTTLKGTSGGSAGLPVTILWVLSNSRVESTEASVGAGASMGRVREELLASAPPDVGRSTCQWKILVCQCLGDERWGKVKLLSAADVARTVADSRMTEFVDIDPSAIAQDVLGDVERPAAVALLVGDAPLDSWRDRVAAAVFRQLALARKLAALLRIRSRGGGLRSGVGTRERDEPPTVAAGTPSDGSAPTPEAVAASDDADSSAAAVAEVDDGSHPVCKRPITVDTPFSTSKGKPCGATLCKGGALTTRYAAVFVGHQAEAKPFVLAFESVWSRGRLLDRVLVECRLSLARTSQGIPHKWVLLMLPSMQWCVAEGNSALASLDCQEIPSKSALLLISVNGDVAVGTRFASVRTSMDPIDERKLRMVQSRECCVM